jgi:hypothetical protein
MIMHDLRSSLVRILAEGSGGKLPTGAGFLVTPSHVITCAHVVADALGISRGMTEQPQGTVLLDFPLLDRQPAVKAKVLKWCPVMDSSIMGDIEDIAVLELLHQPPLPKEIAAAPVVELEPHHFFDRSVRMCGFPKGMDEGKYVNGKAQGLTGKGWIEIHHELERGLVQEGFSGTAVWDKEENVVVGMVVSAISQQHGETTAYMIPTSTMIKAFPEMNQIHQASSKINGSRTEAGIVDVSTVAVSESSIPILHLSDLHFGTSLKAARRWYSQLAEDLKSDDLNCDRLDALIISGDVASHSEPEEYEAARNFLHLLCSEFGLDSSRLVIVPGNHDLNWKLSKKEGYRLLDTDDHEGELIPGSYIPVNDEVVRLRDLEKYKQRFQYFSDFYRSVKGEPYAFEYEKQGVLHHFSELNLLVLGLNSCWEIDHHFKSRASVCHDAVADALDRIREGEGYRDCLKFAVWHHPLNSPFQDHIKDHGFMERLAVAGFCV